MTQEEQREQVIQSLADMMRTTPFTSEFKVVKKPKGIKVIIEVTQEQMNALMEQAAKKAASKREQNGTRSGSAEREQDRPEVKHKEGGL